MHFLLDCKSTGTAVTGYLK